MAVPPFGPQSLEQLRREMDRLFNSFLGELPEAPWPLQGRERLPVNMWETSEAFYVEEEVPGVTQDQIDISVTGNELTIKVRRPQPAEEGVTYHRRERATGEATRVIRLPGEVDHERVQADLQLGVLTVTLPKAEGTRPRKIPVNVRTG